jgi:hypothetical protein
MGGVLSEHKEVSAADHPTKAFEFALINPSSPNPSLPNLSLPCLVHVHEPIFHYSLLSRENEYENA